MNNAIEQARLCKIDVPVGCVIKKDGIIIAFAHNMREEKQDITAHAEILAIKQAQKRLSTSRLKGCELYVTLEPCPMCAGAIINSRIKKIYIGAMDPKGGAVGSKINLLKDIKLNHEVEVEYNVCSDECAELLKKFFRELRQFDKYRKN